MGSGRIFPRIIGDWMALPINFDMMAHFHKVEGSHMKERILITNRKSTLEREKLKKEKTS